jgi:uncharacterized spore protein YtfJ
MEKTSKIREIVETAVINLRQAAETNTIVGKPIETDWGMILPVSQVTFAFVAGGGDYGKTDNSKFAGATGGGAELTPVGFLIFDENSVRMVRSFEQSSFEKLVNAAKDVFGNAKKND